MSQNSAGNRLAREKSPYLLQHARNPVDWHPWGEEAFTRARTERKPIFLSIGYSTCHWCHVMERESFEDEAIAAFLNEHFVPVKVDREERPDVDRVYMTALQAMGQGGGWPLSMFLTPDLRPFYGGTYYPPENRYGKIGFPELLRRIHEAWTAQQTNVEESAGKLAGFLREISSRGAGPEDVPGGLLGSCFGALRRTYDPVAGGFGGAPKFPRPVVFDVLLRYHRRTRAPEAVAMTLDTLKAMAAGGIADHLGGGFHRYAVDAEWRVPHFEKMLYDQAQIAAACLDAYLVTGDPGLADAARGTFAYVLRDLTHPEGGFFSAEDADSLRPGSDEEAEGAYYVWTRSEITGVLGEEEGARFCEAYGVEEEGNVPFDPQNEFTGRNILYRATDDAALAAAWGVTVGEVRARLSGSRERLRTARCERPRPHRDDKVLTSWNGLMIGAFARGFRVLGDEVFRDAAERAARFVRTRLARDGGAALLRRWRDGEARFDAQLDDYAFLAAGLLELHEATLEPEWLLWAAELAVAMEKLFWDDAQGGFFDTTGSDPTILARMKESYDGAEPSGNAVAAGVFARLAALTGDTGRRDKAERTLRFFARQLREQPHAMPRMIAVADFLADPPRQAVLAGQPSREDTASLLQLLHRRYDPNRIIVGISGSPGDPLEALLPRGTHYPAVDGRGTLYVCENFTCALPTSDPAAAAGLLSD